MNKVLPLGLLLAALLTACSTTPTKMDRALLDIRTNTIVEMVIITNVIEKRVEVPVQVERPSPSGGAPILVTITNVVTKMETNTVTVTNEVKHVVATPKESVETIVSGAAGVIASPSGWGAFASTGAAALLALYARNRQNAFNKAMGQAASAEDAAGTLAQNVEVARRLLEQASTTPQSQGLAGRYKEWLMENQNESGVFQRVTEIVDKNVDSRLAKDVATRLSGRA